MPPRDRIVIGASAGGIEALTQLIHKLPGGLPAAIFVVVHFPSEGTSRLPEILGRAGQLQAAHAFDGEAIQSGRIYVAPPDYHLLLQAGAVRLVRGPREHGFRPAIDPLFRSAAQVFGPRVVGVLLSGNLSDGVLGLLSIQRSGGETLVQDPAEAIFPALPSNAIQNVQVDRILPVEEIANEIQRHSQPAEWEGESPDMADENELESIFVLDDMEDYEKGASNTQRTVLTCPDCGGLIWELQEGQLLRFRCHVGHAYSSESMLAKQGEALETALWTAVRTLEERASLLRRLATHAQQGGSEMVVARYNNRAAEVERQADVIRKVLADGKGLSFEQVLLPQVGQEENNPGRQAGEVDMGGSRGRPD